MTDVLYDVTDVETAVRDAARDTLPSGVTVYAGVLPVKAAVPYVLFTVRAPRAYGLMMSGDQTLELTLSWTCTGVDHIQAGRSGSAVRAFVLGREGDGSFTTEIPIDDERGILQRESNSDGAPDNVGGVQQWTETAQVTVGRK